MAEAITIMWKQKVKWIKLRTLPDFIYLCEDMIKKMAGEGLRKGVTFLNIYTKVIAWK